MRKLPVLITLLVVAFVLPALWQPENVLRPALNGQGPLAVTIDARLVAPEYHSPVLWWRTYHMDALNGGQFTQASCLQCHNVKTSCNNCHAYVGVKPVVTTVP